MNNLKQKILLDLCKGLTVCSWRAPWLPLNNVIDLNVHIYFNVLQFHKASIIYQTPMQDPVQVI